MSSRGAGPQPSAARLSQAGTPLILQAEAGSLEAWCPLSWPVSERPRAPHHAPAPSSLQARELARSPARAHSAGDRSLGGVTGQMPARRLLGGTFFPSRPGSCSPDRGGGRPERPGVSCELPRARSSAWVSPLQGTRAVPHHRPGDNLETGLRNPGGLHCRPGRARRGCRGRGGAGVSAARPEPNLQSSPGCGTGAL